MLDRPPKPKKQRPRADRASAPDTVETVPVVAIGASAGGLEPIETLFASLPPDIGLAFIVVQHLSPDFRSMMAEILGRHSTMEIVQAQNGLEIRPNTIYLNPPRRNVTLRGARLEVTEVVDPLTTVSTVDTLFRSLAEERGPRAIGIVLSGSGSDGSRGAEAIHRAEGVVIVQDPETAKFDGMPCAAIARGAATFIAPPDRMRAILQRLAAGDLRGDIKADRRIESDPKTLILALLRDRYGSDFGLYKNATIGRRIDRRITMKGLDDIAAYAALLQSDAEELDALYHDILIGVTSFFRDREAFQVLREQVIPKLVDNQRAGEFIRVWVPGCATGEEAYSLAIAFDDYAERSGQRLNLKILATDVHKRSLETAARGIFPKAQMKNVDRAVLQRYFEATADDYVAQPRIRKYIVFSAHDLTSNAPFTRIDLVSCRNLLIYLNQPTQQKVLTFIHFALKKDGFLFLGPSETIGRLGDEFATLSETWRIYQKLRDIRLIDHSLPTVFGKLAEPPIGSEPGFPIDFEPAVRRPVRSRELTDVYDALLKRFAPAGFLINAAGDLVRVFGDADRYVDVTQGAFSQTLTDLLIGELRLTVAAGIEHLKRAANHPYVRVLNLRRRAEGVSTVEVRIEPFGEDTPPQYRLVTVRDVTPTRAPAVEPSAGERDVSAGDLLQSRIKDLERDIATREVSLQALVEEFETSNEELQAANEELMASNEELQSTNEELHSVNEELYTVSSEHQRKIGELIQLTSDMEHLLKSTNIGTMFVDRESRIRSFTPMITHAFNLMEQDVGRPLSHITARFDLEDWPGSIRAVIQSGTPFDREVVCDGRFFLLRGLPYRLRSGEIDGAVITLVDIDALHRTSARLEESEARFRSLYRRTPAQLQSIDRAGRIVEVSDYWLEQLGYTRDEVVGTEMTMLLTPAHRETFARDVLPRFWQDRSLRQYPCEFVTKSGAVMEVELSAILEEHRESDQAVSVIIDVTERNHARRTLELRNRDLERSNEALGQYANMASHDLQEPLRKIKSYCSILGLEIGPDASEDARYAITVLSDASERLSMLVSSLLQFSRVSSSPMTLSSVDLDAAVRAAMSNLEVEIEASGAKIEVARLPMALGDRTLIECVFQNLIGNALKYRAKGRTPDIRIEVEHAGEETRLRVVDNGIGFDNKHAAAIFEPLRRLHGKSEYPGTGIGLAVTKAIVDRHGWSIAAEATVDHGATFTITLAPGATLKQAP